MSLEQGANASLLEERAGCKRLSMDTRHAQGALHPPASPERAGSRWGAGSRIASIEGKKSRRTESEELGAKGKEHRAESRERSPVHHLANAALPEYSAKILLEIINILMSDLVYFF